ncbi:uncharacterized protein F4822DRAFT_445040 [Hypoxylon trugodes]|uniref:uncharacterized protein n=1 Tax=Hypoxylon trugodes TaxID=326681 RepID=UPI002193BDBF|nr:uncharacterized protein F4822DRAFT_445040 [Hypoxylon trugodes]KAI1386804.1 hypothetical protein F4822DRAFT_445040 [Hypoxylon trugodes]
MGYETSNSAFERSPIEIITQIFKVLEDPNDIHSLLLTSKTLYNVYSCNKHHIARSHIFRLLDPDDYKLAVMAIESRKVDPLDQNSLTEFFNNYVHHDEWDIELFRMGTVHHLPELITAASRLEHYGTNFRAGDSVIHDSPTEKARKFRAYYMHEIGTNLFHRFPDPNRPPLIEAPYNEWVVKFWANFSPAEIVQVELIKYWIRWNLFDVFERPDNHELVISCFGEHSILTTVPRRYLGQFHRFAEVAGIQKLYKWHISTESEPDSLRYEWLRFKDELKERDGEETNDSFEAVPWELYREAINRGGSRFQADPESSSDIFWNYTWDQWGDYRIGDVDGYDVWPMLYLFRHFRDKATIERLRRIKEGRPWWAAYG